MAPINKVTVHLELPRDLLGALNVPETGLGPRLKELIALELFREGQISSGKAAELLNLPKAKFIQLLARYNINYFTESPAELEADLTRLEQLLPESE